jgi:Coenzyme PQQ synthesis protein D (PqqD)
MAKNTVTNQSFVVAISDQVSTDLAGKTAILNMRNGTYYGLDEVGSRIWHLLQDGRHVGELRDVLLQEYDVEPDRCERDLLALLQQLADQGLIEVK